MEQRNEEWLQRWQQGRTGWHEDDGNQALHRFWPGHSGARRVLVPLCGKTPDLLWLAQRGHTVAGIELSRTAVEAFFADNALDFELRPSGAMLEYRATSESLSVFCGDYFDFLQQGFDALYDRGSLVALPAERRERYVQHTKSCLIDSPVSFIITLEYDQAVVDGPPFAVMPDELLGYWPDALRVADTDDIETCPPKFREAGLTDIREVVWLSDPQQDSASPPVAP